MEGKGPLTHSEVADILADTIVYQEPPLTVGVFGKWSSGKTHTLRYCRERIEKVTKADKRQNDLNVNIFKLLFRLCFFNPVLNSAKNNKIRFIFVDFSILDYAGSDKLWAGVITHITNTIDCIFGKWAVKIFRAWHYKPERHLDVYLDETSEDEDDDGGKYHAESWECPSPRVFLIPVLVVALIATALTLWLVFGIPSLSPLGATSSIDITTVVATSAVGLGIGLKLNDLFKVSFLLLKTQTQKIATMAKHSDFSSSLGFMGKVKTEVYYITSLVRYLSVFLHKNLRICLIIDDVDLLGKDKIMNLFQVANLLRSSRNSQFIQFLCMDSMIAANLIKKGLSYELAYDISGHAYLRKHIELPFHIPSLDVQVKRQFLKTKRSEPLNSNHQLQQAERKKKKKIIYDSKLSEEIKKSNESYELKVLVDGPSTSGNLLRSNVKKENLIAMRLVKKYFLSDENLAQCIDGDEGTVRRIVLSAALGVQMMRSRNGEHDDDLRLLVAWISFVDQWPYRISWIRQTIEDNTQLFYIDKNAIHKISDDALLEHVYILTINKLALPEEWETLLELDGDPELFVRYLQHFPFTVNDMKRFLPYTTNLDSSIRRIIADDSAKDNIKCKAALLEETHKRWKHKVALQCWSENDICDEIAKMGLREENVDKYSKIVQNHHITGNVLCQTPISLLRERFDANPGDWAVISCVISALMTFFGVKPMNATDL
ncbi:unnamed protein product [Clavelina lepadiformis]|uniref:KAP NTPase domain-containing protein n=1 Tax=Clavelina lepadiformis TaxID=159417 RepID=A0ABP0FJ04_CLALP